MKDGRRGSRAHASRRGALFFSLAGLVVLSTSPLFGHHLARGAGALFVGKEHIFSFCLIALHVILSPIHQTFHVLLYAGLAYALFDRVRAYREMKAVLRAVKRRAPQKGEKVWSAAMQAGVDVRHILVVDGLPGSAFTVGGWSPKILVSTSLPRLLSIAETASVLAHEEAHRRSRDPLTISLLRFLSCVLFYIPALRRLAEDITDEVELVADDFAAKRDPLALASAIVAVAGARDVWTGREAFPALGFNRDTLLERRVRRLVGAEAPSDTHITGGSVRQAAFILAMIWISGLMMIHPSAPGEVSGSLHPAGTSRHAHCEHHGLNAFAHLFCLGGLHTADSRCPHST